MTKNQNRLFFTGKGGVGKSTAAALAALRMAEYRIKCGLISMDPAHNLSDIFMQQFGEKLKSFNAYLSVKEVDEQYWMKKYLQETEDQITHRYNYHSAFALKNYFKVLQFSPGLEEYALIYAFGHILQEFKDFDMLIFDMPPTALTLRFFALPGLSLVWINELTRLRRQIYKKQEIVSRVRTGKKQHETDNILAKLNQMRENQEKLQNLFSAEKTKIQLVINEDSLSVKEAQHIERKLKDLQKTIHRIIINKATTEHPADSIKDKFSQPYIEVLPLSNYPLTGKDNLQHLLAQQVDYMKAEAKK